MPIIAHSDPLRGDDASHPAGRLGATRPGSVLARRWPSILVWLVLALGAATAYLAWETPLYRASTSILLDPGGVAKPSQDEDPIASRLGLVSMPAILAQVVDSHHLVEDPEFNTPPEPVASRLRALVGWEQPDAVSQVPREQLVLAALAERVDVERSKRALSVEVVSRDPAKAARLVDSVAAAVQDQLAPKADAPAPEPHRPDPRLRELEDAIRADERKLDAYKAANPALAGSGAQLEQQAAELHGALLRARTALSEARAKLDEVERAAQTGRLDGLPSSLRSGAVGSLRGQLEDAQRDSEVLTAILGPRHPDLIEAQRQLQAVRALVRDELRRIAARLRNEVEAARSAEMATLRRLEAKQREVAGANQARAELRRLETALQTDKAAFDRLRTADAAVQQEGATTPKPAPIVQPPAPALLPLRPESPDARAILLSAAVLGLVLGLITALLREHGSRASAAALESRLGQRSVEAAAPSLREPIIPAVEGPPQRRALPFLPRRDPPDPADATAPAAPDRGVEPPPVDRSADPLGPNSYYVRRFRVTGPPYKPSSKEPNSAGGAHATSAHVDALGTAPPSPRPDPSAPNPPRPYMRRFHIGPAIRPAE